MTVVCGGEGGGEVGREGERGTVLGVLTIGPAISFLTATQPIPRDGCNPSLSYLWADRLSGEQLGQARPGLTLSSIFRQRAEGQDYHNKLQVGSLMEIIILHPSRK